MELFAHLIASRMIQMVTCEQSFEAGSKFAIENGVYDGIQRRIQIAEPE